MERWTYEVGRERWDYEQQDKDGEWIENEERKLDELTNTRRNETHGEEG